LTRFHLNELSNITATTNDPLVLLLKSCYFCLPLRVFNRILILTGINDNVLLLMIQASDGVVLAFRQLADLNLGAIHLVQCLIVAIVILRHLLNLFLHVFDETV